MKTPEKVFQPINATNPCRVNFIKAYTPAFFIGVKMIKKLFWLLKCPFFLATNIEQHVANLNINVAHFGILVTHLCIFKAKFVLWNDIKTMKFAIHNESNFWRIIRTPEDASSQVLIFSCKSCSDPCSRANPTTLFTHYCRYNLKESAIL